MNPIPKAEFHVKTEAYQGPFGLVLELIEARKLLVNDLALAIITEDFIQHVRNQPTFPIDETAYFIQVAATLLLIKSRSLLPDLTLTEEENADVEDLKKRLEIYERVRDAARELSRIYGETILVSAGERDPDIVFSPPHDLSADALQEACSRMFAAYSETGRLPEARVRPLVTIEDMMDRLAKRVQNSLTVSFRNFAGDPQKRVDVIISFLALLELVKQGVVAAEQPNTHGDIRISHTSPASLPRYA